LGYIYAFGCELKICDIIPQDFIILYILQKNGKKSLRKIKKEKKRNFFWNKWHIQLIFFNLWESFNWGYSGGNLYSYCGLMLVAPSSLWLLASHFQNIFPSLFLCHLAHSP